MTHKKRSSFVSIVFWIGLFLIAMNWQTLLDSARGAVNYRPDLAGPVTVFSTTWCGYCKKTKRFLTAHDIPFEERDIEASDAARDAFQRLGGSGVPLVLVGEQVIHGYSLNRLRAALECADCDTIQQEQRGSMER